MPTVTEPKQMSLEAAEQLMHGWHTEAHLAHRDGYDYDYDPAHHWGDCQIVALARIRSLCHSVYVVQAPGSKIAVLDYYDDGGPPDALHADLREGWEDFEIPEALMFAAELAAADYRAEREG